jgi:glycosyltransferase involved in cell wall biosynthesis
MKILQVLNHFLPQQIAGTEVYTWALSKELIKNGAEVKVLIPNYGKNQDESFVYDGIPVHQFAEPSEVDRALIMGFREADGLKNFEVYLEQEKPDIVHFHELAGSNGIGLPHVRVTKKMGAKVIMTFHLAGNTCATGTLMHKGKTPCDGKINTAKCSACYLHHKGLNASSNLIATTSNLLGRLHLDTTKLNHPFGTALGTANIIKRLEKKFLDLIEYCDQVVCITNWYQQVLMLNGVNTDKVSYILQGLPTVGKSTVIKGPMVKPIQLMFLGRISPFKGLHILLEALEAFSELEFELSIFGSSDGTNYESMLRGKTKMKKNIQWRGTLDQEKVLEEMQRHDLLCLCSTFSEMSPLVIQEARAAGLPILASNVIGNKEQLEQGAKGFLFEMNKVASLIIQLSKIKEHPIQLREMSQEMILPQAFSEIASEYLKVYHKIIQE